MSMASSLSVPVYSPRRPKQAFPAVIPPTASGSFRAASSRERLSVSANSHIRGPARNASLPPAAFGSAFDTGNPLLSSTRDCSPQRSPRRRPQADSCSGESTIKESFECHWASISKRVVELIESKLKKYSKDMRETMHEVFQEKALATFQTFEELAKSYQSITLQLDKDIAKICACSNAVDELKRENMIIRGEFNQLNKSFDEVATSCHCITAQLDDDFKLIHELQRQSDTLTQELGDLKRQVDYTQFDSGEDLLAKVATLQRQQQKCIEDLAGVKTTLNTQVTVSSSTGAVPAGHATASENGGLAGDARAILTALAQMRAEITRLAGKLALEQESREKALTQAEILSMFEDFKCELRASAMQFTNAN